MLLCLIIFQTFQKKANNSLFAIVDTWFGAIPTMSLFSICYPMIGLILSNQSIEFSCFFGAGNISTVPLQSNYFPFESK